MILYIITREKDAVALHVGGSFTGALIVSRFSSQPRHVRHRACVPSELPLVFRRPINLNARSSKGESAAAVRSLARSRQFLILHGAVSLSFLLLPSLSRRNELPCTNVCLFSRSGHPFPPRRELQRETERYVSGRVRHGPTSLAGQRWSEHTCTLHCKLTCNAARSEISPMAEISARQIA